MIISDIIFRELICFLFTVLFSSRNLHGPLEKTYVK